MYTECVETWSQLVSNNEAFSATDAGFLVGGGRRPPTQELFGRNVCENKRIGSRLGKDRRRPLDPPLTFNSTGNAPGSRANGQPLKKHYSQHTTLLLKLDLDIMMSSLHTKIEVSMDQWIKSYSLEILKIHVVWCMWQWFWSNDFDTQTWPT